MDPVISYLVQRVRDSVIKEVKFLSEVKKEVEEMQIELQWMQSFLEDADHQVHAQSRRRQSRVFCQWVSQIREASLDAEDVVDTYLVKLALSKRSGILNFIQKYGCIVKRGLDIHAVGSEIEALKSKLSTLRTRLQTYGIIRELNFGEATASSSGGQARRSSYAHIVDNHVVGLEENIVDVVGLLLRKEEQCRVVSIYGMGGLGKTTLAKKVYHNDKIRSCFEKFAWVSVSQQFKARDVWETVYVQLTSPKPDEREEIVRLRDNELLYELFRVQRNRKCFILLDDIWSIQDWCDLSAAFPLEESGKSKMVITTRNMEVAEHVDHRGRYGDLKPLSEEQAMELLRKIAIEGRDDDIADNESMEKLGKEMLEHCGGLPLAITVLAGILATKYSLSEWQIVNVNIKAYLRRGKGHNEEQCLGVYEVLAYSYYDLPRQLKSCFLYLSQFPEDHEIHTKRLLRMWMAEGLISVQYDGDGEETIEDVADRYLNELVDRCMIQVEKEGTTRRVKTCRIHDLMREMCLSKAKEENFIYFSTIGSCLSPLAVEENTTSLGRIRRVSFVLDRDHNMSLSHIDKVSQLRSLILYNIRSHWSGRILRSMWMPNNFKLLRMLVLEWIETKNMDFPKEVGNLIHLRYLSLRGSSIYGFPSLEKLGCLETLDLRVDTNPNNDCLSSLNAIWKMKYLRHLYLPHVGYYSTVGETVEIINNCPNLQTLVNFPPRHGRVSEVINFSTVRKLKILPTNDQMRPFGEIFRERKVEFSRLSSLSIAENKYSHTNVNLMEVLMGCPNLYKLEVEFYIFDWLFPQFDQWPRELIKLNISGCHIKDSKVIETLGKLPNLKILGLLDGSFEGPELYFTEGSFPRLKLLKLESYSLKEWRVDKGAMPILQSLRIRRCGRLEMLPEGLRFIGTLKELHITGMYSFGKRVHEGGADFYKVQHVPSIIIKDR